MTPAGRSASSSLYSDAKPRVRYGRSITSRHAHVKSAQPLLVPADDDIESNWRL